MRFPGNDDLDKMVRDEKWTRLTKPEIASALSKSHTPEQCKGGRKRNPYAKRCPCGANTRNFDCCKKAKVS